jgi:hypothetical protein
VSGRASAGPRASGPTSILGRGGQDSRVSDPPGLSVCRLLQARGGAETPAEHAKRLVEARRAEREAKVTFASLIILCGIQEISTLIILCGVQETSQPWARAADRARAAAPGAGGGGGGRAAAEHRGLGPARPRDASRTAHEGGEGARPNCARSAALCPWGLDGRGANRDVFVLESLWNRDVFVLGSLWNRDVLALGGHRYRGCRTARAPLTRARCAGQAVYGWRWTRDYDPAEHARGRARADFWDGAHAGARFTAGREPAALFAYSRAS